MAPALVIKFSFGENRRDRVLLNPQVPQTGLKLSQSFFLTIPECLELQAVPPRSATSIDLGFANMF